MSWVVSDSSMTPFFPALKVQPEFLKTGKDIFPKSVSKCTPGGINGQN